MKHLGNFRRLLLWLAATLAVVGGCTESVTPKPDGSRGTSSAALEVTGPTLVADLKSQAPANPGSAPSDFVAVGDTVFFAAQEASSGRELWLSDGTPAGTRLVRDLRPGTESSNPRDLTVMGGHVYFVADVGSLGRELWRTDGTAAGTVLVKDIFPGTTASNPSQLKVFNGLLYFSANTSGEGTELWRSDGTTEGTVLFKDLLPGSYGSSPEDLTVAGSQLFFTAAVAGTGREVWRSDGTAEGTFLLKDVAPGGANGFIKQLVSVGDRVYFVGFEPSARISIWTSDGTPAGTRLAYDPTPGDPYDGMAIQSLTAVGGTLYFVSAGRYGGSLYGYELWKTDGTSASLVADIAAGSASSWPEELVAVGPLLYFRATDSATGTELWKLDTAKGGLQRVADVRFGSLSSTPQKLTGVDGMLYFTADDGDTGRELWKTDGTSAGTVLMRNIGLGTNSSTPEALTAAGSRLFFSADDGTVGRELWSTDGAPASTSLTKDILVATADADPQALTVLGDSLYFTADAQGFGREPWVSDPSGTRLIKDIYPGNWGSSPRQLLPLNGALVFDAEDSVHGRELWTSNGTEAGTRLLKDIHPAPYTYTSPYGLQVVGDRLYFIGNNGSTGFEPWISDGTSAGTRLLKDLTTGGYPDSASLREGFVGFKNHVYFGAYQPNDMLWKSDGTTAGTVSVAYAEAYLDKNVAVTPDFFYFTAIYRPFSDIELWRSDGTADGTWLVHDIGGPTSSGTPGDFALLDGLLYFSAAQAQNDTQRGLWRSDGTWPGTWLVKQVPGGKGLNPRHLVEVNGVLLFQASDAEGGTELWRSDGTTEGTVRVRDIAPGPVGGVAVQPMLALEPEGLVVFVASDGLSGLEPWISDGTEAGTRPLGDLAPGAYSSNPRLFTRQGEDIFFVANDGTTGFELWRMGLNVPVDTTPPTITCPSPLSAEAQSTAGARVSLPPASVTDDRPGRPSVSYSPASGTMFPFGTTSVTATARDAYGNTASCAFSVTVVDTTAPTLSCPANVFVEATSASGGRATSYPAVTVTDASATQVTYSPAPGNLLPLGVTTVTATAKDARGNTASCTFNVTVRDTTGPAMTCPASITADAINASGATVSYPSATASDAVSPPATVSYSQASGTVFPLGQTPVTATGRDALGNQSTCTFFVTVRDTTPPTVTCPKDVVAEATSASGALVSYPPAIAVDNITASPELTYSQASGTLFPLGMAVVFVGAKDAAGNSAICVFRVSVRDTTKPAVTCPASVTAEATSASGATVSYPPATATDAVTPSPTMTYSHPSGALFPLGKTSVTVTARDTAGNSATCTFSVTVQDTTAPAVSCPADVVAEATSASGAVVSYPAATASDAVTASPALTYSHASGTQLSLGTTRATVTATDGAGNASACSFNVTVRDATSPAVTCPATVTAEATSASGAAVSYPPATASDAVTASPVLTYSQASGTGFPFGMTTVTVTATDAAGNAASCVFDIVVQDTTAPTLSCPADVTAEATHATGALVSYASATASDAVTGSPEVTYSQASGTLFPMGITTVTVTARDAAGNAASCSFEVSVGDATKPEVTCPANITAEATSASGAAVSYPAATASDTASPPVTLGYSHESGTTFPLGVTTVTVTATDAAGNAAACAFDVTVQDTTAPALTCPSDVITEATSTSGATVSYASATVSDAVTASPALTYSHASGTVFASGTTAVTLTAKDAAGNSTSCTFSVTVRDATAPALTCPASVTAEATTASGAAVSYPAATSSDVASPPVTLSYSQASGTVFPLGVTTVTVTATDAAGNSDSCAFTVTVRDTTAPTLTCPADVTAEATSASGATVSYAPATASDGVTASPGLTYSHASGTVFPLGVTTVTVTAMDAAANAATCSFTVTVRDTTAPALACPTGLTAEATSALGATLEYAPAVASDGVTASPGLTYSHASGTVFPLGATDVTVTARDGAGNETTCHFTLTVRDTTPPAVGCTADLTVEAQDADGAPVAFELASPLDTVTRSPLVSSSHAPGSRFPLGTTAVTVTARDEADNTASCTFSVTVRDTTPPALTCPADMTLEIPEGESAAATFAATASDAVTTSPELTYSHASGTLFPRGTTPVTLTAKDGAGLTSQCTFQVTVRRLVSVSAPEEAAGCACSSGASSGGGSSVWLLLLGSAFWLQRRSRSPVH